MNNQPKIANIFDLPAHLPKEELFEALVDNDKVLIEKIVSTGQITASEHWYDQDREEWLIVFQGQGELSYEDGSRIKLTSGDYLHIPAHKKHRVEYTSIEPPCIWLTIFF